MVHVGANWAALSRHQVRQMDGVVHIRVLCPPTGRPKELLCIFYPEANAYNTHGRTLLVSESPPWLCTSEKVAENGVFGMLFQHSFHKSPKPARQAALTLFSRSRARCTGV
jgi:hypothetical protein